MLRWALVVPAGALGAYVGGIGSALLLISLLNRVCPLSEQVSGFCFAPWYPAAEMAAECAGAALGAVLTVLLPCLLAPSHKRHVAAVAFLGGAIYASMFLSIDPRAVLLPFLSALVAGGLMVRAQFNQGKKP